MTPEQAEIISESSDEKPPHLCKRMIKRASGIVVSSLRFVWDHNGCPRGSVLPLCIGEKGVLGCAPIIDYNNIVFNNNKRVHNI